MAKFHEPKSVSLFDADAHQKAEEHYLAAENGRQIVKIHNHFLPEILTTLGEIVRSYLQLPDKNRQENQLGGALYLAHNGQQDFFFAVAGEIIEFPSKEEIGRYRFLAKEKAKRLYETHWELGHNSSYESRDSKNDQWGGAIVADNIILSFSGLPEKGDEACMLALAVSLGWMTRGMAQSIARKSRNGMLQALLAVL